MKFQIVTPFRVSPLHYYGVTSVYPPLECYYIDHQQLHVHIYTRIIIIIIIIVFSGSAAQRGI
jgi:hypothetical protein